jgi:UDP-glucose 4-epimerase
VQIKTRQIYRGKTILVSGGTGYVGSSLSNAFSEINCNLLIVSRNSISWTPDGLNANIQIINGDVSSYEFWEDSIDNVDFIFHLASADDIKDHKREIEVNALSMLNILKVCKKKKLSPKIVFSSSANIFGCVESVPVDETFPDKPESIWSIHKLMVENYLKLYYKQFKIHSVSLRLPNVYGASPNIKVINRVVINKAIHNALNGITLNLYSNGNCIRDYIFIDDLIDALMLAGCLKKDLSKGQFYVIGSGEGIKISNAWMLIAQKVSAKTGKNIDVKNDLTFKVNPMEMRNFIANSSTFRNDTGWTPKINFEKGIEQTIDAVWNSLNNR